MLQLRMRSSIELHKSALSWLCILAWPRPQPQMYDFSAKCFRTVQTHLYAWRNRIVTRKPNLCAIRLYKDTVHQYGLSTCFQVIYFPPQSNLKCCQCGFIIFLFSPNGFREFFFVCSWKIFMGDIPKIFVVFWREKKDNKSIFGGHIQVHNIVYRVSYWAPCEFCQKKKCKILFVQITEL